MGASVIAVCVSRNKDEKKMQLPRIKLREGHGVIGDAHAGPSHRQVSLLAWESIEKMKRMGIDADIGDFAENITTRGIDLAELSVGARLSIGPALLEITQIGKQCHSRCAIIQQAGECVIPREEVFATVLSGGIVSPDDPVWRNGT